MHKIDYLTATAADEARPVRILRSIPTRLSARAVVEVLGELGFNVPSLAAAADANPDASAPMRFGYETTPSIYAIDVKKIDAALAKTSLPVAEKICYKYALDRLGLLKR